MENKAFKLHRNLVLAIEHFFVYGRSYIWFYFKLLFIALITFGILNAGFGYLGYKLFPDFQNIIPELLRINYNNISSFKTSLDGLKIDIALTTNLYLFIASYLLLSIILFIPLWVSSGRFAICKLENNTDKISILKNILVFSYIKRLIITIFLAILAAVIPLFVYAMNYPIPGNPLTELQMQWISFIVSILIAVYIFFVLQIFSYFCADEKQNIFNGFIKSLTLAFRKFIRLIFINILYLAYITLISGVFILIGGLFVLTPVEYYEGYLKAIEIYELSLVDLIVPILCGILAFIFKIYALAIGNIFMARFYIYNRNS